MDINFFSKIDKKFSAVAIPTINVLAIIFSVVAISFCVGARNYAREMQKSVVKLRVQISNDRKTIGTQNKMIANLKAAKAVKVTSIVIPSSVVTNGIKSSEFDAGGYYWHYGVIEDTRTHSVTAKSLEQLKSDCTRKRQIKTADDPAGLDSVYMKMNKISYSQEALEEYQTAVCKGKV